MDSGMRVDFNRPTYCGREDYHLSNCISSKHISGDGHYSRKCQEWFENRLRCHKALLTPSCTHALEMAAMLIGIEPEDEVIMPSYTFVSTANAFVLRGAKIVFVDIRPDTLNIDEKKIEEAISEKTKAIVPVHYAGVSSEMETIMQIADRYGLYVIEDAAQGIMSSYHNKELGTIAHIGAYSFHETKNFTSGGEGGLLIVNDEKFVDRAEIIREKGTNRSKFFRGLVDRYSWVDIGSSYLMNDLSAAYLWGQLEMAVEIQKKRMNSWNLYYEGLKELKSKGYIELPTIPQECKHNAHIFYIKLKDLESRTELIEYLKERGILTLFHYVPLHSSQAGMRYGRFNGADIFTSKESERVLRLPMYYGLSAEDIEFVVENIKQFYEIGKG